MTVVLESIVVTINKTKNSALLYFIFRGALIHYLAYRLRVYRPIFAYTDKSLPISDGATSKISMIIVI